MQVYGCSIFPLPSEDPSPEQAKVMNEWIDELTEKIEGIRYKLH
jgi:hypothetical protein